MDRYKPWSDISADPNVLHYGLEFKVGPWKYDKHSWSNVDMVRARPSVQILLGMLHSNESAV